MRQKKWRERNVDELAYPNDPASSETPEESVRCSVLSDKRMKSRDGSYDSEILSVLSSALSDKRG